MSYITNVTIIMRDPYPLHSAILEHIAKFEWTRSPGGLVNQAHLGKADTKDSGGSRVYTEDIYVGAFNYLPVQDFMEHLKGAPWNPVCYSIVTIHTEGDYYVLYVPRDHLLMEWEGPS